MVVGRRATANTDTNVSVESTKVSAHGRRNLEATHVLGHKSRGRAATEEARRRRRSRRTNHAIWATRSRRRAGRELALRRVGRTSWSALEVRREVGRVHAHTRKGTDIAGTAGTTLKSGGRDHGPLLRRQTAKLLGLLSSVTASAIGTTAISTA